MGLRRRRKKLTSLLADFDRRVRSTTLRRVRKKPTVAPSDNITEENETTAPTPPVGTVVSETPPDLWSKIIGGYYYTKAQTGGLGQIELYLSQNLGLSNGTALYVSGTEVNWNRTSGGKTYTGSFRPNTSATSAERAVLQTGLAWTGRDTSEKPEFVDNPVPADANGIPIADTIVYTVSNGSAIPGAPEPITFRRRVQSYSATTTTGTITFTNNHHFVVGHILDISDLPAPFSDVDGIIQVSAVPSSTQISFKFSSALSSSISSTTPSSASYAYAVVSRYTAIGSSWIRTSDKQTFIWDGLRWVKYTEAIEQGLIVNDEVPPAPPTSLSLSSLGYEEEGTLSKVAKSYVELSWTAPSQNSVGDPLNDLAGYRVWYSTTSSSGPWIGKQNFGLETSQTIVGLTPEITYYFKVFAFDLYGMDSTGLEGEIETVKADLSLQKPSAPIVTTRLSVIKVAWDGKDYEAVAAPKELLAYVEAHYSTSSGFTPSESTLLDRIYGGAGFVVAPELEYDTDYYFKLVAVDVNNRRTDPSTQVTAKVTPLVDADLIAAELNSPLSVWPFANGTVTAGALAAGSINASNLFGSNVVVQSAIAANAIGADQLAANAVTAGKIEAGAVTTAKLNALAVTADKIAANTITADKINTGYVYAGSISADQISGGTITGVIIRSAASGRRVVINSSALDFYTDSNNYAGTIYGGGTQGVLIFSADGNSSLVVTNAEASLYRIDGGYLGTSSTGVIIGANNKRTYFQDPQIEMPFITSTTSSANVRWGTTGGGRLFYVSSARRTKYDIQDAQVNLEALNLRPRTWFDMNEYIENGESTEGLTRIPGFVAEEVLEAGLEEFVTYDAEGVIQGLSYDRMVAAIIPVMRHLNQEIETLKIEIETLRGE